MATKRSPSWASVVAHGIHNDAAEAKSHVQTLPTKMAVTMSFSAAAASAASAASAAEASKKPPIESPTMSATSTSSSAASSPPTLSSAFKIPPMPAKNPQMRAKEPPAMAGKSKASYTLSQDMQSGSDARRPFRNILPRHPTPVQDRRQHHKTNSQGTSLYRPRRHSYGLTHMHPRSPVPGSTPRALTKPPPLGPAVTAPPKSLPQSQNASVKEVVAAEAAAAGDAREFKLPSKPRLARLEESPDRHRICVSPRARTRCQITYTTRTYDLIRWQPIGKSRQVWQPHDPQHRGRDPSNPMPKPPPGFEHVVLGRRAISSRARELIGDNVESEASCTYPTPKTMPTPERELREQQHFIAKHDTHLTCRQAQLKVTNGGTEDGYYVRPLAKLLPKLTKLSMHPKYKAPSVSYWELVRRCREREKAELKCNEKKMSNNSDSPNSTTAGNAKAVVQLSPNSTESKDPITDNNLPN